MKKKICWKFTFLGIVLSAVLLSWSMFGSVVCYAGSNEKSEFEIEVDSSSDSSEDELTGDEKGDIDDEVNETDFEKYEVDETDNEKEAIEELSEQAESEADSSEDNETEAESSEDDGENEEENEIENTESIDGVDGDEDINLTDSDFEELSLEGGDIERLEKEGIEIGEYELLDGLDTSLMASGSTTKTCNTYKDMTSLKLAVGTNITTKGYYKSGDGGGASYVVSKTKGTVFAELPNGLYANLIIQDTMNPRQFGAVGNGTADDTEAFEKMAGVGVSTIEISDGTYNIGSKVIEFKNHIDIVGSSRTGTILKNVGITAPYGISVKNLTCDGGIERLVNALGYNDNATVMFWVTPKGNQTVEYTDCSFKNTGFVSLALTDSRRFSADSAVGCEFSNIGVVAIFHTCNSNDSVYMDNLFTNIGDASISRGPVSAIWLGDVTGTTNAEAQDVLIEHNTFKDLYTADDPSLTSHIINANFIAVRAKRATITNNTISNVHGYGPDREAVYTKVYSLKVTDNIINNGGFGEGYITCKGQKGKSAYAIVSGNTLTGEYGSGIYVYGASGVKLNSINIANCRVAICAHTTAGETNGDLRISGNTINSNPGYYYLNGTKMSNHIPNSLITVNAAQCNVIVQANRIITRSTQQMINCVVRISNAAHNLTVRDNAIHANIPNCYGVSIGANDSYWATNRECTIDFTNNTIDCTDVAALITYTNKAKGTSKRTFTISKNKLNGSKTIKYGMNVCVNGSTNNDSLNFSSPQGNIYARNMIYTNIKNINPANDLVTQTTRY